MFHGHLKGTPCPGEAPLDVPDLARYGMVGMQGGQWGYTSYSKLLQEWRIRAIGA
jgi:hypothetical protein